VVTKDSVEPLPLLDFLLEMVNDTFRLLLRSPEPSSTLKISALRSTKVSSFFPLLPLLRLAETTSLKDQSNATEVLAALLSALCCPLAPPAELHLDLAMLPPLAMDRALPALPTPLLRAQLSADPLSTLAMFPSLAMELPTSALLISCR